MLILGRNKNEAIQIGDDIEIIVIGIEGDQVKLGINAPKSIDIHRKEIYLDTQKQNNEASNLPSDLLELLSKNNQSN